MSAAKYCLCPPVDICRNLDRSKLSSVTSWSRSCASCVLMTCRFMTSECREEWRHKCNIDLHAMDMTLFRTVMRRICAHRGRSRIEELQA